ncbi:DUF1642 domain-containing protein [Streptococcus suis]|uniref:DUF1642 domain-containing protein n=1 Tax=Streptococcus suis TaxID=1307 RepID=UPI001552579D|nr:DUF1642 domain-containing protein [Streptococcus suis]NQG77531.1 DUF1642 domain-containing protein [Streptococcus suis]NQH60133.1 DUF1642 domain-containing protein [Streptococcus suis]NQN48107.1 DUF1642 domain-containing protein [Streptococcus suis]NQN56069.1 DUF1642 domain-containing protein [Streptococcus suis]NQN76811.1 DUF1642 domain-containing protein [Streptococcus suis]
MNGCTEFIPVTINERYTNGVDVTVHGPIRPFRTTVERVYRFQKPHEPQKVVVPKFIGDLIEELKIDEYTIGEIGACVYDDEEQKWIDDNEELFYRAFLDGFEIEQEKLYTVEIPNPNVDEYSIVLGRKEGKVQIKQCLSTTWEMNCSNQLTESEIKKDFEWAWQWAEPVEAEER